MSTRPRSRAAAAPEPLEELPLGQFLEQAGAYARRVPLEGTLETTYRCNLACVHCYVNQPASDADARARELPLPRLKELIDEIAAEGCLDLLLTGGEVLVRPDFCELYLYARSRGLRVTVFTNGTLVGERVARLLGEHPPVCVEVSLYGMTRETYERVTRVPGSFQRCLDGLRRLRAHGVPLKLKTMALTWNRHELGAMRAFAAELGLEFRHDSLLNPRVDCGANRNPELQLPAAEALAADLEDPATRAKYAGQHQALAAAWQKTVQAAPAAAEREPVYTCGAGQIGFTIDPYGALQMCQLSRRAAFDLRSGSFASGWHEFFPRLRSRTWQSHSACRHCSLRPVCGNCPGAAELEHGDSEARVAQFCELTHLRAFALLAQVPGHRPDAGCCRGRERSDADTGRAPGVACGGCAHEPAAGPAVGLIRLERRRRPLPGSAG